VERAGKRATVWGIPKYVERAASRIAASSDEVTRKALEDAMAALKMDGGETAKALAQGAAEMAVLGAAEHFAKKMVPVMNVALAAWHIAKAAEDFKDQGDDFFCALDPRDALVAAAPSAAGLALDIALEAAFAVV
jgi:hypothetical protein